MHGEGPYETMVAFSLVLYHSVYECVVGLSFVLVEGLLCTLLRRNTEADAVTKRAMITTPRKMGYVTACEVIVLDFVNCF